MNTKTFKKPLAYYRELYTNQLLIDKMNKIKPIQDQDQKKPVSGSETIYDKIIKAFQLISLGLAWFVFGCSVALLIKYLLL
jgi:hypothetical protein